MNSIIDDAMSMKATVRVTCMATCLVLALLAVFDAPAAAQTMFRARLSSMPFDLSTAAVMAGSGSTTATLTGSTLVLTGTFEGLSSPATVARLHKAQRGVRGEAFAEIEVTKATSGTIKATLDLTPAQLADLRAGRFYVQIHSEKAPDGNVWGWLLPQEAKR